MIGQPFISIITVCYNSERCIRQTIESVLKQDFTDYEYIIVDGKSKDGTIDIIRENEAKFKERLKWISEPDKGIYDAMNKGIRMAKGKLVWLVNSDDYIQPGAMSIICNFFTSVPETEWPIVSFAYNRVSVEGDLEEKIFFDKNKCNWCARRDYMGLLHPATIVPRRIYETYALYDTNYRVIADLDWFRRMLIAKEKMEFVNKVITNMRDGGASATHYYKDRIKEYRYYCYKNYSFIQASLRFFRLWLLQNYGHIVRKYLLKIGD